MTDTNPYTPGGAAGPTTPDGLRAAREVIADETKWQKFTFYTGSTGCFCLAGAVGKGVTGDAYSGPYMLEWHLQPLADVIARDFPARIGVVKYANSIVYDFNDHPATTHQDVLHVLDETIRSMTDANSA